MPPHVTMSFFSGLGKFLICHCFDRSLDVTLHQIFHKSFYVLTNIPEVDLSGLHVQTHFRSQICLKLVSCPFLLTSLFSLPFIEQLLCSSRFIHGSSGYLIKQLLFHFPRRPWSSEQCIYSCSSAKELRLKSRFGTLQNQCVIFYFLIFFLRCTVLTWLSQVRSLLSLSDSSFSGQTLRLI